MYNIHKIEECVYVHSHSDFFLIKEYIYSLSLKLESTLPPDSFKNEYIYSLENIIIWSPDYHCTTESTECIEYSQAIKLFRRNWSKR